MSRAFLDESGSNVALDPHAYLLGSVIILEPDIDEARATMRALRLPGQRKLHWRNEDERRRMAITETIIGLPLEGVLVAHVDADRKQEARRHRTIATLLPELHGRGVEHAEFESRTPKQDAGDRKVVDYMRRSHRFDARDGALHVSHTAGDLEPCLWIADAICGAVVSHRTGDSRFVDLLGDQLQMLDC